MMSPGLPDQDAAAGGGVAPVGGIGVGAASVGSGGLGGTKNYYFPKVRLSFFFFRLRRFVLY